MRTRLGAALGLVALACCASAILVVVGVSQADVRALAGDGTYASTAGHASALLAAAEPREPTFAETLRRCRDAHPLQASISSVGVPPKRVAELLKSEPAKLGSATFGGPTRGALFNGVLLGDSPTIAAVAPSVAWGTEAVVASLHRAVAEVQCRFVGTPKLMIGSLSKERGGYLWPHKSHQTGVDVDVGFYYSDGSSWYVPASAHNLDAVRSWALLDALISQGNVEYIFVDVAIQPLLRAAALEAGESEARLADLFDGSKLDGSIVRHARGHDDHIHVRFRDPVAGMNAGVLLPFLGPRFAHLVRRR